MSEQEHEPLKRRQPPKSAKSGLRKKREIRSLQQKRGTLLQRQDSLRRAYYGTIILSILFLIVMPAAAWRHFGTDDLLGIVLLSYIVIPLSGIAVMRARLQSVELHLEDTDFEIDLQQFEVGVRERRAEKILRINGIQLRRYYDLNLSQNIWVFGLGILCILLGIGVIAVTLYLVLEFAETVEGKIITGVVGSIGSLLVNYVAAIYLKMHASATSNLAAFHSRLVGTQQALLGNLLASRIEDETKRWETLSKLALKLGTQSQV